MAENIEKKVLWNVAGNNLLAQLGLNRRVPISIEQSDDLTYVIADGTKIAVPASTRWSLYKRGFPVRQSHLLQHYGIDDVVNLRPGDVVLDIGANIGEVSMAMAERGARVVSVEGDPSVFRCLQFNTRNMNAITCLNEVIWKETETLTFHSEPKEANSSIFRSEEGDEPTAITVQATTLDIVAEKLALPPVAFLKCDAEGAEPEVILGGQRTLATTRAVAFETSSERMGEQTTEACSALLAELGFTVHYERRRGRHITFGFRA